MPYSITKMNEQKKQLRNHLDKFGGWWIIVLTATLIIINL